jgi:hypothetical protein
MPTSGPLKILFYLCLLVNANNNGFYDNLEINIGVFINYNNLVFDAIHGCALILYLARNTFETAFLKLVDCD